MAAKKKATSAKPASAKTSTPSRKKTAAAARPKATAAAAKPASRTAKKPSAKTKPAAKPIGAPPARREGEPLYWLFKSEPDVFSWDDLVAKGEAGEEWDGVRNYLARNNMRAMALGDLGFYYHSNAGKDIVGICKVSALAHPDSTTDDDRWECVDVAAVCPMPLPVTLAAVKDDAQLKDMALVTSMRLSVQPVTKAEWMYVCAKGGLDGATLRPLAADGAADMAAPSAGPASKTKAKPKPAAPPKPAAKSKSAAKSKGVAKKSTKASTKKRAS